MIRVVLRVAGLSMGCVAASVLGRRFGTEAVMWSAVWSTGLVLFMWDHTP